MHNPQIIIKFASVNKFVLILTLLACVLTTRAQEQSVTPKAPKEQTYLFGFGSNALYDTYLSQEHYSGTEIDFLFDNGTSTVQAMFATTKPRSERANDLVGQISYAYAYTLPLSLGPVALRYGLQGDVFVGGIYNTANGNNPAELKAGADLAPTLRAAWPFTLGSTRLRLRYVATIPLLGAAFSPQYGQSYYEIFATGNYDHNICLTHIGQAFNLHQRLTLDFFIGRRALTVGYMNNIRQSNLNALKYHDYSHAFVIGYTL